MVVALSSSPSFLRSISDLTIHPSPTTTTKFSFINSPPTSPTSVRFRSQPISASYTSTSETSSSSRSPPPNFGSPYQIPSSTTTTSLYEVLGIQMGASSDEIKSAYRKLARVCHPDVVAIQRKDTSADEFMKIHAAYTTLSDPEKRTDYDRKLFRRQRSYSSPASPSPSPSPSMKSPGFSGYTGRNWETDQCW